MSFREKSAWVCLFVTSVVWAPCFGYVFLLFAHQNYTPVAGRTVLVIAIGASTLLNVAAHIAIAHQSRREPKDERDVAVDAKSSRNAYYVLLALIACLVFTPTFWWQDFAPAGLTHQALLLSFVTAEIVRFLSQAMYYRRGMA